MKQPERKLRSAVAAGFALALAAGILTGPALADVQAIPRGPTVKLVVAQNDITAESYRGYVFVDPGIYVTSLGSVLQFDVQRASYTKPITITQVIHRPGSRTHTRPLPGSLLDGFYGLRDFLRLSIADSRGKLVASSRVTFCPNSYDPQRATPNSAPTSQYPQLCGFDPFPKSLVMGVARGWGVDPPGSLYHLGPGDYKVTETITPRYMHLLHITAADATASVNLTVVKGRSGCCGQTPAKPARARGGTLASSPPVPNLPNPPKAALPDLVPLPSWSINTLHTRPGRDLLDFGATVWVGNAPLDVEGFRSHGSPVMKAYQYFWLHGHVIGRTRAGTMGFADYNHWHFKQFARYTLVNSAQKLVIRSHKEGFCIAPTDPVDLLAPRAVWQPPILGLGGQCGVPTALWVQEMLPAGWGDTYFQNIPGESFNITSVPNGTYYIKVTANPLHLLHELNTRNDISLRKIILGGTPGHRTVKVPAWHGIDPEK
jgi:hypothetical protein